MTDPGLTQDEQRTQEIEIALERARGHVGELRRLAQVGAPLHQLVPYLDQLEADLNTARPVHVGWADYQRPVAVESSPTGLSGTVEPEHVEGQRPEETGGEAGEVGDDGLTDAEREQVNPAL